MKKPNREYWSQIVRGSVHFTEQQVADGTLDKVIDVCVETDLAGSPCGSWHATAVVTGRKCNCYVCNPTPTRR